MHNDDKNFQGGVKVRVFEKWFDNGNKHISITNFREIRKRNREEYGDDPEINTKRRWGIHTNGAKRGVPEHSCLDFTLDLGHFSFNYTNFSFNKRYRQK
jgi:hypothetical protein